MKHQTQLLLHENFRCREKRHNFLKWVLFFFFKFSCKILEEIERERQKFLEMRKIYGGCISMKIEEMAGN